MHKMSQYLKIVISHKDRGVMRTTGNLSVGMGRNIKYVERSFSVVAKKQSDYPHRQSLHIFNRY